MFAEAVARLVDGTQMIDRNYSISIIGSRDRDRDTVKSVRLLRIVEAAGVDRENKHRVPRQVLAGTEAMQRGFLQALFTADGTVIGSTDKGLSVRLAQSDEKLLEEVQMLLLNFGIASKIYRDRREPNYRSLPDGKGGLKDYWCKAQHELVVGKVNLIQYQKEIGFLREDKQVKLETGLLSYGKRGPYSENFTVRFDSLTEEGVEPVYDLTEPRTHSFVANGLVVHNCGEQPLLPNESCNLGSINLTKFVDKRSNNLDWDALNEVIKTAVHFLDNVITVNPYPSSEINQAVKDNRRIGLGVMGWADLLFTLQIPYNSQAALDLADKVMSFINRIGHEKSAELAKIRGNFPAWPNSIFKEQGPMRNSTVTTIAPTGSISIIAGASSGIEPIFALAFRHVVKQPEGGERVLIFINPVFEYLAKVHGFWSKEIEAKVLKAGSVRGLKEVPEDFQAVFVTAHEVGVHWHVNMQAAFQRHTDNGVSKTINISNDATHQEVKDAYLLAYTLGCLGITVFRDGCKNTQVLHIGGSEKPALSVRPMKLQGITYRKNTPIGTCYITVNEDINTGPFEVFINVGRAGSAIAADAEALGRLISLIFRSSSLDERIQDVIAQLRGIGSGRSSGFGANRVMSLADAVAQVLAEHAGIGTDDKLPGLPDVNSVSKVGDFCPDCGQATFVFEEGCQKCYLCGYSEC
jgi:ribonucleoside-diphosphate reductase alpha chain